MSEIVVSESWSTSQKVMGVALVVVAPLLWLYMRKNRPDAINDKMQKEFMNTIEHEDHPLKGRSRELVNLVLKRLGEDPMLAKFFPAHTLQPHSLMGVIIERYVLVAMGEPYVTLPLDLKEKHKNFAITREHYQRFKDLWKRCEQEMGIEGKDIWTDLEDEIVSKR